MGTYILLTRLSAEAIEDPKAFDELNERITQRLKDECSGINWLETFALLGPYDYLDIFEAPDNETATHVALIIRSFGHATTEIWPATPWLRFREMLREMVRGPAAAEATPEDLTAVDEVIAESFPASDPPPWTPEAST